MYKLDHDDPFSDVHADILTYEKIGKVLVMGDFNARVGTLQNLEVDNVMVSDLMCDSDNCTMSDYKVASYLPRKKTQIRCILGYGSNLASLWTKEHSDNLPLFQVLIEVIYTCNHYLSDWPISASDRH